MRWVSRAISMQGAAAADGKRPQVQVLSLGPKIQIQLRLGLDFFFVRKVIAVDIDKNGNFCYIKFILFYDKRGLI